MNRRFVNLVTHKWLQRVYSVRRIDPYNRFFYGSAKEAIEAAEEAAEKKESFPAMEILQLPSPSMNFAETSLDMFALFSPRAGSDGRLANADQIGSDLDMYALFSRRRASSEGRLVYANPIGDADLYDADENTHIRLGSLNSPKGLKPMCLSIAHPGTGEDSMYVLNRYPGKNCFEVLHPMRREFSSSMMSPWRWRVLPPPPFVYQPGYKPSLITSFTTIVDGPGCSTIYVSCDHGIGTYSFVTAHPDSSRYSPSGKWSHVGEWNLPFDGRAQYIPEFKLWFGFSPSSPSHLCAVDLSVMGHQGAPAEPQTWQDLNPPEGEVWKPMLQELVHLGDGKFLIAKSFKARRPFTEQFAVLTGIEMIAGDGDDHRLRMVKHKCARIVFRSDTIQWVL